MKSQSQLVMLVIVFMVLIAGVAFVKNWITTKEQTKEEVEGDSKTELALEFPNKVLADNPDYEIGAEGHRDFWFENSGAGAIEVGLNAKSCKCSEVAVLVLTPDEAKTVRPAKSASEEKAPEKSATAIARAASLPAVPANLEGSDRWKPLKAPDRPDKITDDTPVVLVPPHASGFVRLGWEGRALGPQRLKATIWFQFAGKPETRTGDTSLEVPILLVPAVRAHPDSSPSVTFETGQQHEYTIFCWSTTRPKFHLLSAKEESGNRCFACSFKLLEGGAFAEAAKTLGVRGTPAQSPIYAVTVTAHERLPDGSEQLDLGPFQRKIIMTTDLPDHPTLTATINGTVRGEVTVGTDASRDKINLPTFPSTQGTTVSVPIQIHQAGLKLTLVSKSPDFLHAELRPPSAGDDPTRWKLIVNVPANRAAGNLPADSVIVLRTETQPPRVIRIPVVGTAKVR